jgi:ATP-dependent helicase/nuclease subunit B
MLLTLTPNRRLANSLELKYAEQQIKEAKASWLQPQIKPLMSWVGELFAQINIVSPNPTTVLSKLQQQLIVEQIILDGPHQLLNIANTAMEVINAVEIMELWRQPVTVLQKYSQIYADSARFLEWTKAFNEILRCKNFITQAGMLLTVIDNLHLINLPRKINFYAFDEINPLQEYLLEKLQQCKVSCELKAGMDLQPQVYKTECLDSEDEYIQASKWAVQELNLNPNIQLAVIIPNLTQDRKLIVDLFSAIIPAEKLNISAPVAIKKYKMIELVFLILKICNHKFKYDDLLSLIKSPYISTNIDTIQEHTQLILALQDNIEYYTDLPTVLAYGDSNFSLVKKFNLLHQYLPKLHGRKRAHDWINDFNAILEIFAWPKKASELSLTEQHLLSCFADILEQYLFLDNLKPKHTFNQALEYLHDLCENVPFLPVDSGNVQVHVLGLLEGVGLQFDKIWVANMSRDQWPQEPKPNPFIPQVFQYQYNMPRSSASRELEIAISLTNRLLVSASMELIFSYALSQDGSHASCSPLIKDFTSLVLHSASEPYHDKAFELEELFEENITNTITNMALSTQMFRYQAECSFKAFAHYSLLLKNHMRPEIFLNASERGSILHQALARFWAIHKTSEQLVDLYANGQLYGEVQKVCKQVMHTWKIKKPFTLTEEYLDTETARLIKLVYTWLQQETTREPFTVVAIEQRHTLLLNSLTINCQIDRIDDVGNGAKVIIDYKTGSVVLEHMTSPPLLAPQLPIYALTQNNADLIAIVYAIVKPNDLRFVGLSIEKNYLKSSQAANLSDMLYMWQNELHNLADKFINQPIKVNPINQQACLYCNFQSVCRIYDVTK